CPGKGSDAARAAVVRLGDAREVAAVEQVEAFGIDFQSGQCLIGERLVDDGDAGHGAEIAYPAQEPAGDARRTTRAPGDLMRAVGTDGGAEYAGAARHHALQFLDA